MPRFEKESPGIEQGRYYIVTANSKIGKSQITDHLFLYQVLNQIIEKGLNIKLKVFYFTLELSKEEKFTYFLSNLIYIKEGIRIPPKDIMSTTANNPISTEVLQIIEKYKNYAEKITEIVEFIDSVRNPTGIFKFVRDYAYDNGVQHKKIINMNGENYEVDDYYQPNDPDEYVMIIIDHISLISQEAGMSLHESISKLSGYFVQLRNKYNYIPVVIQQQAAAQESIENFKLNKLKPSLDGLGDNKLTARDRIVKILLKT